jgi:hypothetical protein
MEILQEMGLEGFGLIAMYFAAVVLGLLAILLPLSAYAAQKWAYKTYLETKSMNAKLAELVDLLGASQVRGKRAVEEFKKPDGKRREPTISKDLL